MGAHQLREGMEVEHGPREGTKWISSDIEVLEAAEETDGEGKIGETVVLEGEELEAGQPSDGGMEASEGHVIQREPGQTLDITKLCMKEEQE